MSETVLFNLIILLAGFTQKMRPLTREFCERKTRELIESRAIAID